jgi:ribosomal protein S18 acetylase RimI-like enzyme
MDGDFEVVPMRAEQWRELRALRLEMLADEPLAYVESLAAAQQVSDDEWQARAVRYTADGSLDLVAVRRSDGQWVGTMSSFVEDGRAWLVAVYVAPGHRGRTSAVADALLDGVEQWVADHGHRQLWLEVHEANPRAQAFYRRRGYRLTGQTRPYDLDPNGDELEMVRDL